MLGGTKRKRAILAEESGEISGNADSLKRLISLGIQHQGFVVGKLLEMLAHEMRNEVGRLSEAGGQSNRI